MEIQFIYHKSSLKRCEKLIPNVVPANFIEVEGKTINEEVFVRKFNDPAIPGINIYFVFFSKPAMLTDRFAEYIHDLYSHQEKTRLFQIQPVRLDDCIFPLYILRSTIISFTEEEIKSKISEIIDQKSDYSHKHESVSVDVKHSQDAVIEDLKKSYAKKEVILYCGAGTSFNNGVPTWKELLYNIFVDIYITGPVPSINIESFYEIIDKNCGISLPILARYLKNELKDKFEATVARHLYKHVKYEGNELISSIVDLCKVQYNATGSIKSIITTNFDDIFEKNFEKEKFEAVPVYDNNQQTGNRFPIYHVHGFLPKDSTTAPSELVFSEDAYHNQFYLPYKWQNLIQLDAFNHNTCLFIGVGFTDPNLRRLLDISRTQCGSDRQHYIIRQVENINKLSSMSGFSEKDTKIFLQALNRIQEEDAKKLGLKYILVNNYDEIPQILRRIGQD